MELDSLTLTTCTNVLPEPLYCLQSGAVLVAGVQGREKRESPSKHCSNISHCCEDCFSIVKEGNAESIFIPPKALNIVWGNDRRYWQWRALN
ncbi:hypothetical protein H6P81_019095 [Aristolochia fimbriata]|uniref:Uncharacterized protein n=1 Tax=Aristolochia fimbriata TaxID=158543 RepID=A0AAV7DQT8_ARIFI|nr:hypothetical protein H6P81_019095 [Aristolochia fimbriata]